MSVQIGSLLRCKLATLAHSFKEEMVGIWKNDLCVLVATSFDERKHTISYTLMNEKGNFLFVSWHILEGYSIHDSQLLERFVPLGD